VSVLVVGAGFAGWAAAWELRRNQQPVTVLHQGVGAAALYSGALDRTPWTEVRGAEPLPGLVLEFLASLGWCAYRANECAWVVSNAGQVRPARAVDSAVLNLAELGGRPLLVLDPGRPGWDAVALAQSCNESTFGRKQQLNARALRFEPPEPLAFRYLSDLDLAELFDDAGFQDELVRRLQNGVTRDAAFLFGPWLGKEPASARRLRQVLDRPLGEVLSEPGGIAGARFEQARDRWLKESGVRVIERRLAALTTDRSGAFAELLPNVASETASQTGALAAPPQEPEPERIGPYVQVILATGGIVGGGIRFRARDGHAPVGGFSLSYSAPVQLSLRGRDPTAEGAPEGADLQALGLEALESVGIAASGTQVRGQPRLQVVGAALADRARTALEAIESGLVAARVLAQN
jgi:hypothetical protein